MSVAYRSTCRPTIEQPLSVDISTDISVECPSTYRLMLDRYRATHLGRHIDRHSTDMSTDTSVDMSVEECTKYTWSDRSLPLFLLHILPLCNVWQHLNTCASRVIQVHASHAIALNKSRPKILARVSLNANCLNLYLLQAVCYCLHLYVYGSKVLLYYFTVKRDTVYALCQHVIYVSLPVIINRS